MAKFGATSSMLVWLLRPVVAAAAALLAGLLAVSRPQAPTVPLVNLTALALGDAAELAVLRRAARGVGVFRVVGHGVDGASVINASKALFALPLAAKLATSTAAAGGAFQRGYIPLGGESGLADYFEVRLRPSHARGLRPSPSPQSRPPPGQGGLLLRPRVGGERAASAGAHRLAEQSHRRQQLAGRGTPNPNPNPNPWPG